ncbi:hypothetical protein LCGC14_1309420, partial [marine sediment metagenome]
MISGLTFSKLLSFVNNQINTNFLFYETCYSGGLHLVEPFEKAMLYPPIAKGAPQRMVRAADIFNYTIAAGTVSHVTTMNVM